VFTTLHYILEDLPSISSTFNAQVFRMKVLFCQNVTKEMLREALSYEKCASKMLLKLTPYIYLGKVNQRKNFGNTLKYRQKKNLQLLNINVAERFQIVKPGSAFE